MMKTILTTLICVWLCHCSPNKKEKQVEHTLAVDKALTINDRFLDSLRSQVEASSIRYLSEILKVTNADNDVLRMKNKILASGEEKGVRRSFFNFLKTQHADLGSYALEDFCLVETTYEGEVFSAINYLLIEADKGCQMLIYKMDYGKWGTLPSKQCNFNPNKFFENTNYVFRCDDGKYSSASDLIITHITTKEINSKVLNIVCKQHLSELTR